MAKKPQARTRKVVEKSPAVAWVKLAQASLDCLTANVFVADRDKKIVFVNQAARQTLARLADTIRRSFGVEVSDLVGLSIHRFHKDPRRVEQVLADPRAMPHEATFEFGGVELETHINIVQSDSQEVIGYVVVWDDVTGRRRVTLDHAGQLNAIRRLQAMVEFELDGTIINANENFLQAMGYRIEEIRGRHHSMFVDQDHVNSTEYRQFWQDLMSGHPKTGRFRRFNKQGHEVWIQGSYFPILDDAGRPFKVVKYAADVSQLRQVELALEGSVQSLASSAGELTTVSQQMASNSEETAAQASVVSAAAEQVSRNVGSVASATEEMGASIREIAKNASEAARVAMSAVKVAERTNATVSKLGESSAEIGNVIKVITSIAQQTNLLALNATIEAARAGEAGKGFAVVANEVKELAKQTARATEDIGRKIEAIQADAKGAIDAIAQIGSIINQINDIQSTIAGAVEEQTATTSEISRSVSEAALGSREIAENVLGVAQAAQSTSQGATNTKSSADSLARIASELQRLLPKLQG